MKKTLTLLALITLFFGNTQAQNWDEIIKTVASDRESGDEFGWSVAISGNYAIVGAAQEKHDVAGLNILNDAGSAYVFERNTGGTWIEVQKLVASDRGLDDRFGYSVAMSGDYAIVGAFEEDNDIAGLNFVAGSGSAYIFERNVGGVWIEVQKLVASDRGSNGGTNDFFGISVSISGDYVIVGAHGGDEDAAGLNLVNAAGSAYVFERNVGGVWNEVQKLVASDREADDWFGWSVSISGAYAIVAARQEDHDAGGLNPIGGAGSVYVFERDIVGNWVEVQKLVASDRGSDDRFGYSIAISGSYAVVGAYLEDHDVVGLNFLINSGSAYVFERNVGGVWIEVQKLVPTDRNSFDLFGSSVSISGDYILVGADGEDDDIAGLNTLSRAGSAYIFERSMGGSWNEEQKLVASDREADDWFGYSVAISGAYAIVGAPLEDHDVAGLNTLSVAGSAYMFAFCSPTAVSYSVTACGSYTVPSNDEIYTAIGTYPVMDTISNTCGKDSIMTITVTILPELTGSVTNTICNDENIVVNGTTYNAANPSGTEIFPNIGPNNCDSTVTINLNVLPALTGSVTTTLCNESLTNIIVNGTAYNTVNPTGIEVFPNIGPNNCDSTVSVNLNVLPAKVGSVTNTICNDDSIVVNGTTYNLGNSTGIEVFTNIGVNNCDSIVTVNLSAIDISTTIAGFIITSNQTGATYQWIDCTNGNVVITGAINASYIATANGDYAVVVSLNGCTDTSACVNINTVSVAPQPLKAELRLYPNPAKDEVTISLGIVKNAQISILTITGKTVFTLENVNKPQTVISLKELNKGIYFVKVKNGQQQQVMKLIKQ